MNSLKLFLLSFLFVAVANAGSFGDLAISGTGCVAKSADAKKIKPVAGQVDHYEIPLQLKVEKKLALALERKACNFRLPVKLEKTEKIVVSNYAYDIHLFAEKGSRIKSTLDVFLASKRGKPSLFEVKAIDKNEQMTKTISSESVAAESDCGKDAIVSGNLSVVATGVAKAAVDTDALFLTLQIVKCK